MNTTPKFLYRNCARLTDCGWSGRVSSFELQDQKLRALPATILLTPGYVDTANNDADIRISGKRTLKF